MYLPLVPPAEMLHRFGATSLRAGQRAAYDAVAAGRDVLVILPTGGGKSLCYQLPAACGAAPAVVVSPLVALMKDQVDALQRRGIAAAQLSGAVSAAERARARAMLEGGELTVLYVAPEALVAPATLALLARVGPRLLAIDEAHCISEWGESFRPTYLRLGDVRRALGSPPTIALTATATPRTARDIVARLALKNVVTVAGGFDRTNLRLHVRPVATDGERHASLLALGRTAPGATIVYANSRRETERLSGGFTRAGIAAAPFHAGMPTGERALLQDRFQANRIRVIVATNAFGMGVDKPDVRLVLHAAPPRTLEAYYQEAGRGGRDGAAADCVMLVAPGDLARDRSRIAAARVTADLLVRLVTVLSAWSPPRRVGDAESAAVSLLGRALDAEVRNVAAALRLLQEEGALAPSGGAGRLRLLASESRLATDRTLDPADIRALRQLVADGGDGGDGGDEGDRTPALSRRQLALVAPDGDATRFLRRLESLQVAVWQPLGPPFTLRSAPSPEMCAALAARHAVRQGRDLWRHRQVARMVTSPRCRRVVLLRYFGDAGPVGPCGACDVCGIVP